MLLTHNELTNAVAEGYIENVKPNQINAASIDLTLGSVLWYENQGRVVDLANKKSISLTKHTLTKEQPTYGLHPGQFILASTEQVFHLPNWIAAEYKLKSSMARNGLGHLLAGWCDPGWNDSVLTLELKNETEHHHLIVKLGMPIGQIVLWRGATVPDHASYATRGSYNKDRKATPSKGLR